jgi:hypothetical protein
VAYYGRGTLWGSGEVYGVSFSSLDAAPLSAVCLPLSRYLDGAEENSSYSGYARIDLSWGTPNVEYTKYRVRRSMFGYPRSAISGDLIFEGIYGGESRSSDTHYVRPGTTYFYRVFVQLTGSTAWSIFDQTYVDATASSDASHGALQNALPRMYLSDTYDSDGNYIPADSFAPPVAENTLSKFLEGVGFWIDTFKEQASQFIAEPREMSKDVMVPKLMSQGFDYTQELPYESQRRLLDDKWFLLSARGTRSAISAFSSDVTGWKCRTTPPVNLVPSMQDVSFNYAALTTPAQASIFYADGVLGTLGGPGDTSSDVQRGTAIFGDINTSTGAVTSDAFSGYSVALAQMSGTFAAINVTFEGSYDNTTWSPLDATLTSTGAYYGNGVTGNVTNTSPTIRSYVINVRRGFTYVRARATARTSGTMRVTFTPINVGSTCVTASPNITIPIGSAHTASSASVATQPAWANEDPAFPNKSTSAASNQRVLQLINTAGTVGAITGQSTFGTNYPPMYSPMDSGSVNPSNVRDYEKNLIPVEDGELYNFMFAARRVTPAVGTPVLANAFAYMTVAWYDIDRNLISSENVVSGFEPPSSQAWGYFSGAAIAPANAARMGWFVGYFPDNGDVIHLGGIHIEKVVGQLVNLARIDGTDALLGTTAQAFWVSNGNQTIGWPKLITSGATVALQMKALANAVASIKSDYVPVKQQTTYRIAATFTPTTNRTVSIDAISWDATKTISSTTSVDIVSITSAGKQWSISFQPPQGAIVNGTSAPARVASTAYMKGSVIRPATANGCVYQALNAGTTGASLPSFATSIGSKVTDGTVLWQCIQVGSAYVTVPFAYMQLVFTENVPAAGEILDIRDIGIIETDDALTQGQYPSTNNASSFVPHRMLTGGTTTFVSNPYYGSYKLEYATNPYRDPRTVNVVIDPDRINLLPSEDGSWGSIGPTTFSSGLTPPYSGATSNSMTNPSTAATQASPWEVYGHVGRYYIVQGQWLTFSTYVKLTAALAGVTSRLGICFTTKTVNTETTRTYSSWTTVTDTGWVRLSVTTRVPDHIFQARIIVQAAGLPVSNSTFRFDGTQIEVGRAPTDLFNAEIETQDTVRVSSTVPYTTYSAQYFDKNAAYFALSSQLAENVPASTPYRLVTAEDVDWIALRNYY